MREITIDNTNSNVVCYDAINMYHADDSQVIKLNTTIKGIDYIEVLCRLWEFNRNEKLVYRLIINKLFKDIIPNKQDIIKECSINTGKNTITYNRAIEDLRNRNVLAISINGTINLSDDFNIYNYLNNKRSTTQIKYITLKI